MATKKKSPQKKSATKKSSAKKSPARKKSPLKKAPAVKKSLLPLKRRSTLTFQTESLPMFTVGQAQKFSIQGVGGTKPYSFGITQGTLPAGLALNSKGTLGGTPTQSGDTTIFVKLIDFVGANLTQAFDLQVQ